MISLGGREWHYWALVTNDLERSADELESWHRAKANLENKIKEAKLGLGLDNLPCASFHANWAYLLITLLAYNLLAWLKLPALPDRERQSYAKRLRFRFIAVAGTVGRSGRRLILRLSAGYSLFAEFVRALEKHPRPRARTHLKPQPPPATQPQPLNQGKAIPTAGHPLRLHTDLGPKPLSKTVSERRRHAAPTKSPTSAAYAGSE